MKKKPFLLLEVLISFLFVFICIIPLIKNPLQFYRTELGNLEKMEKDRLADWTFSEVKEMLLKNEISWDAIPHKWQKSVEFRLPDGKIYLPNCRPKIVKRKFILTGRGEKVGKNGEDYRLLGIFIQLDKDLYRFRLPAKKIIL